MLVLIQHQLCSNVPKVYLQGSRNEPYLNFYKLIGFVPCLSDDEEIADFPTLPPHAHMVDSEFVNLVLLENMLGKAGFSHIDCSLSDTQVEQSAPASLSTLVYCCFPPPKCMSEANLEACCKGLVISGLLELLCIQPEHPTFDKPMGYAGKGFVKGDTSGFVISSTIKLVYLLRSGLHDQFVTTVPLQIAKNCQYCHGLQTLRRQRSFDSWGKSTDWKYQRGHSYVLIK